jgi:threonine dehydratase
MTPRLTIDDIVAARDRIAPYIHRTPILSSSYISETVGTSVVFKCENLQKVGAFKARGALNAVLLLSDEDARKGVVTHSSGNHGQAVAYACAVRGIPATVVMPEHAPSVKIAAVKGYGATVTIVPHEDRTLAVDRLVAEQGLTLVHPFDDVNVIAGQGTAALELLEDVPDIDVILAPIGGGGLLSGTTVVALAHGVVAMGVEPELVDDSHRSLRNGVRQPATGNISVGDGLLTGIGAIPFAILSGAETKIVLVDDDEMIDAMRTFATRMKIVVEPSGATVLAALIRHHKVFSGLTVGAIISGGNVELSRLSP